MKKWLISCNLMGNDILQQFLEKGSIFYETGEDITKDDEVFIYGAAPLSAVFLRCSIKEIREKAVDENYIDKYESRYMKLVPIENYLSIINEVNYEMLIKHGLNKVNFDGELNEELGEYLASLSEDDYICL